MPNNDPLKFRPTDRQQQLIELYQRAEGGPDNPKIKSEAIRDLLDLGLAKYFGGIGDRFFYELSKASLYIAVTISLVSWSTGLNTITTLAILDTIAYVMFGLVLGSLVIHFSAANPVSWLTGMVRGERDEASA